MTKGHFHTQPHAAEIYHCLQGEGYLLLQTRAGEFREVSWRPGSVSHFSASWAHRVVNTGADDLVFAASYHYNVPLDYEPIIARGFRKRLVKANGAPQFTDDPRWPSAGSARERL
jgi:glucose-6-phosphate isomerase